MIDSLIKWNEDIQEIESFSERNNDFLLNELIYTRLVSSFELFLSETAADIFTIRPNIFSKLNKTITLHYGEVLSLNSLAGIYTKILNSEIQNLSRIGFEDILKFYLKLDLDFRSCGPGKEKMLKYHEIRHLIIHRLGKTDSKFKKNYNYHKEKIRINKQFLNEAINDFKAFVNDTIDRIEMKLSFEEAVSKNKQRRTLIVQIWYDRALKNEIINSKTYIFKSGENLFFLNDIVINRENLEDSVILTLKSKPDIVNAYLKKLSQKSANNPNFTFEIKHQQTQSKGSYNLSFNEFKKIEKLAEEKKLTLTLQKEIASILNISITQVRFAFRILGNKRRNSASS